MSSYYTNEQKKEIYKRWKEQGELWFSKDPSKDPTWEEKQIIIEMKKKEAGVKSKRELELEKRTKQFRVYEKKGKIQDSTFDTVSKELGDY